MNKPIQIENKEWWFKGCFIQEQDHPLLSRYLIFKDTELQENIDTCHTFKEAKIICIKNEVKEYKLGYKTFI